MALSLIIQPNNAEKAAFIFHLTDELPIKSIRGRMAGFIQEQSH